MSASLFSTTVASSLPFGSTSLSEQIIRPVARQESQPHIEIVAEIVSRETCFWVLLELPVEEFKDFRDLVEPFGVLDLFLSAPE